VVTPRRRAKSARAPPSRRYSSNIGAHQRWSRCHADVGSMPTWIAVPTTPNIHTA
jgi:hypothetical protein